jgi:endonuclease YncB( thermonuclease family)
MIRITKNVAWLGSLVATTASSQQPPLFTTPPDWCGDPSTINQAYASDEGIVTDVLDAVTLQVDARHPPDAHFPPPCAGADCILKVRLVNLDAPSDPTIALAARQSLAATLRSQHVSFMISPMQDAAGVTNAIVFFGERNINEEQLASGYATYREFGPYAIDWYLECEFMNAQRQAQGERQGIWSK